MKLFGRKKQKRKESERNSQANEPQQRVISYYTASRRQLDNFERTMPQNESLAYRRIERIRSAWFTIVVAVVVVVAGVYLASLSVVPHVTVQGTKYRSVTDYEAIIGQNFSSDLRNHTKPFLQTAHLEQAIAAALPEAQSVTVSTSLLGHRPNVKVITDAPMAVFMQTGSTNYVLSSRGKLLLPASDSKVSINSLPIIQNLTGVQGKAGEQFMTPDEASAFARLLAQFQADNSLPIFTLDVTPHEILAKEPGRGNYNDKFLLSDNITLQYGALRATQKKLGELKQTPAEYIDVRLADKVFYK